MLEILIGVRAFTSTRSFDTKSLQFVTMNELKKAIPGGLYLFTFNFVVSYNVFFLLEIEATSNNVTFVGKWGKCVYP